MSDIYTYDNIKDEEHMSHFILICTLWFQDYTLINITKFLVTAYYHYYNSI